MLYCKSHDCKSFDICVLEISNKFTGKVNWILTVMECKYQHIKKIGVLLGVTTTSGFISAPFWNIENSKLFRNYFKMEVEPHVACAYRNSMLNIQYAKEIYKFPESLALKEVSQLQWTNRQIYQVCKKKTMQVDLDVICYTGWKIVNMFKMYPIYGQRPCS